MTDQITYKKSEQSKQQTPKNELKPTHGLAQTGRLHEEFGSGESAKESFIWITIKYSFYIGAGISTTLCLRSLLSFQLDYNASLVEDLKTTWSIFVPLITLALGYALGTNLKIKNK